MKDCVVTGMGVVSPIGLNVQDFWTALCAGRSGIGELSGFALEGYAYRRGGEIASDALWCGADEDAPQPRDRATRFMLAAAAEAVAQAGLRERTYDPDDVAVVLATNFGAAQNGQSLLAGAHRAQDLDLGRDFREFGFWRCADHVAARFGFTGMRVVLSLSCSSGCAALGYGLTLIRRGRAKAVLTGGYDALSPFCWSGLGALRTMTRGDIRPFDKTRDGTLFSEGAGALLVEDREYARAGGAAPLAVVAGAATNNNAFHMTAPCPDGAGSARVMAAALRDANLTPAALDHINAHGTGTKPNDSTETRAIKTLLGPRAARIPITANKSVVGHMMGAAGSVECIASIQSIRHGVIPPTINYREPDPECDLDCVPNQARRRPVRTVLSNSAGIGGCNAAAVFAACE
jgi:3-oxoacyl-[acyl-carrier-protein] synthase II